MRTRELKENIKVLCHYIRDEEAQDYDDCRKGSGNENGIFPVIVALLNYVNGTDYTPDMVCDHLFGPVENDADAQE